MAWKELVGAHTGMNTLMDITTVTIIDTNMDTTMITTTTATFPHSPIVIAPRPPLSPHVAHPAPPLPSLPSMQPISQDEVLQQFPPPTVDGTETPVQRFYHH